MNSLILPQDIYCDEAGFTGNRMLDAQQPMFIYASVAMEETEARELVAQIRRKHHIEAKELKGSRLARTRAGRDIILDTLQSMRGRYLVTAYEKKLSLACKFFEYIFEPVLAANNSLFYANDFNKFIATLVYVNFSCNEEAIVEIVSQFERFMRSLDPQDAPVIFGGQASDIAIHNSLSDITSFIDGYRDIILAETAQLDNWVLDLSISGLWTHLAHWGDHFDILRVLCDDSKPLQELTPVLDVMVNRTDKVRVKAFGKDRPLTFNLARPLEFDSSLEQPGLQLADVASSAFLQALICPDEKWSKVFLQEIEPHIHEDCILPDLSYMDLGTPGCAVNALILSELGERAANKDDPLDGMEDLYAIGHATVHYFLENLHQTRLQNSSSPE